VGAPEEMADPQAPATFERSKLRWSELRERPHRAILDWYRSLTALRRSTPDLLDPRLDRVDVTFDEPAGWLVETRGAATIALNIGARDASLPIAESAAIRLASDEAIAVTGGTITLPPDSVAVLVSA